MAQTYLQIQQQIAALQRESEIMRLAEVRIAIDKARAIISRFALTAEQLGLSASDSAVPAPAHPAPVKKAAAKKTSAKKTSAKKVSAKQKATLVLAAPVAAPVTAKKAPATKKAMKPVVKKAAASAKKTATPAAPAEAPLKPAPAANKTGPKYTSAIRYRDGDDNSWSGFGPKPKWLVAGIAAGRTLESFAVGK